MRSAQSSTLWVSAALTGAGAVLLAAAVVPTLRLKAEAPAAATQPAATAEKGKYVGPGSCAATACHGSIKPAPAAKTPKDVRIQQTEYTTWVTNDRHSLATRVLSNDVSVNMGKILQLKGPNG